MLSSDSFWCAHDNFIPPPRPAFESLISDDLAMSISDLSEHHTHTTQRGIANKPVNECKASETRNWLAGPTENMRKGPPSSSPRTLPRKGQSTALVGKIGSYPLLHSFGELVDFTSHLRNYLGNQHHLTFKLEFYCFCFVIGTTRETSKCYICAGNLKAVFSRMEGILKTKNVSGHS